MNPRILAICVSCTAFVTVSPVFGGATVFVDADATGANNGTSWTDAFTSLQDALGSGGSVFWVAEGTYAPDIGVGYTLGDQNASFTLLDNFELYGGFDGTEVELSERDINAHVTILSGDLSGDDMLQDCSADSPDCDALGGRCVDGTCITALDNSENTETILVIDGTSVVLDGFTVSGGKAVGISGGGITFDSGDASISNCSITGHEGRALDSMNADSLRLTGCRIERNTALAAPAGVLIDDNIDAGAEATIFDCVFTANYPQALKLGAINPANLDSRGVFNCGFYNNGPAAVVVVEDDDAVFANCMFVGNEKGMQINQSSDVSVVNSHFVSNMFTAGATSGVGLSADNATVNIANCVFWRNAAFPGGMPDYSESRQISFTGSVTTVNYSLIDGLTGTLGGVGNLDIDPLFVDIDGPDDIMGTVDDDLRLRPISPLIDAGNEAALPPDSADLDDDANVAETLPLDLDNEMRVVDDPATPNSGASGDSDIDIGAYEYQPPRVIYVNAAAKGGDGTGWRTAYNDLQDALVDAQALPPAQIWIAAGTYKPASSDTLVSFELINDVAVYGGFAGTETALFERDTATNETILSGDLAGDDALQACTMDSECATVALGYRCVEEQCIRPQNISDNSDHVVVADGVDRTAVLDGVTITGGYAVSFDRGGGLHIISGSPSISNCRFIRNVSSNIGGAMDCTFGSDPFISDCYFEFNYAAQGGVSWNATSSITYTRCTFIHNVARISSNGRGGATADAFTTASYLNCVFASNSSLNGGAHYNSSGDVTFVNCLFHDNQADDNGAALFFNGTTSLINTTVSRNAAGGLGGGAYVYDAGGALDITNSILWGNIADSDGDAKGPFTDETAQIDIVTPENLSLNYSLVQGLTGGFGGTGNIDGDPLFADDDGPDNMPGDLNDDFSIVAGSPAIDAGDTPALPTDALDLDDDGDTAERLPIDLAAGERVLDDPGTADTGIPGSAVVDLGAYEYLATTIIYVKQDANGANDGSSWSDAFNSLQDALTAAQSSTPAEVWVAAGTYRPDDLGKDRSATFALSAAVALYGGFSGTESELDQRDPAVNVSLLSGDLSGDDATLACTREPSVCGVMDIVCPGSQNRCIDGQCWMGTNRDDNSYLVISATSVDSTAILDGFTIKGGFVGDKDPGPGGGMLIDNASPTIRDCTFVDNFELSTGGAITIQNSSTPELTTCTFDQNASGDGGAIYIENSAPILTDCLFTDNVADGTGGGGVYHGSGAAVFTNCRFISNTVARFDGGGAAVAGSPTFINCLFAHNESCFAGSGLNACCSSTPQVINSSFISNRGFNDGNGAAGLRLQSGATATVTNCLFWDNTRDADADEGGPFTDEPSQISANSSTAVVDYTLVQGLTGGLGGTGNVDGDPLFRDLDGDDDIPGTPDDDFRVFPGSPVIDAANTPALPADTLDLDGDGDILEYIPIDLSGDVRQYDDPDTADTGIPGSPVVDMGAYEFTGGCFLDVVNDCNGNGIEDECDIFDETSADCNGNDIPDECDIASCDTGAPSDPMNCGDVAGPNCDDCNFNGIPDCCDIANMTSVDADGDGVPDECTQFVSDPIDCAGEEVLWSCPGNWIINAPEMDAYPDEGMFTGPFNVILDSSDDVFLDVEATIATLLVRDAAVLRITLPTGPAPLNPGDLLVTDTGGVLNQGTIYIAQDHRIDVPNGEFTVDAEGQYAGDPDIPEPTSATVTAGSIIVNGGTCPSGQGSIVLDDSMGMIGDVTTLSGPDDPQDVGCCPPSVLVIDAASMTTGDIFLDGRVDIEYASSVPLTVSGDFINNSPTPIEFDFDSGGILLNGDASPGPLGPQLFEVGGRDLGADPQGFVDNFELGTLEIAETADVTFVDEFDNDGLGQALCTEALYVQTLTLGMGSTLTLDNCRIYYETLDDQGGTVNLVGCATFGPFDIADPPETLADCADTDDDGIRDDNCMFWEIVGDACVGTDIVFGDMGGAFGLCPVDGAADGNDRFHALNCFSDSDPNGGVGDPYPCEDGPPVALNVDAGGAFGSCSPDGVCDGNDAFAALNAFGGSTSCGCPLDGGPSPNIETAPQRTVEATLALRASTRRPRPGDLVEVDVLLRTPLKDLRGYQLHLDTSGGISGRLELIDITMTGSTVFVPPSADRDVRRPRSAPWSAFNIHTGQMVAGLDTAGIAVHRGTLATFTYRVSANATGTFTIDVRSDHTHPEHRTFLFPTPPTGRIDLDPVQPLRLEITDRQSRPAADSAASRSAR